VAAYFGSIAFGNLAPGTQCDRRRILEHFRSQYGGLSFAILRQKNVEDMLVLKSATPHAARHFLKALRGVIAVAIVAGLRADDPTADIRNINARSTGGCGSLGTQTASANDIFSACRRAMVARFSGHFSICTRSVLPVYQAKSPGRETVVPFSVSALTPLVATPGLTATLGPL
jgi:hypothetical protein